MLHIVGFEKKEQSKFCFNNSSVVSNTSNNVVSFESTKKNKDTEREKAIQAISERVSKIYW
jgi:hypothetical protein